MCMCMYICISHLEILKLKQTKKCTRKYSPIMDRQQVHGNFNYIDTYLYYNYV